MSPEAPPFDPELTPEQLVLASGLSSEQVEEIDAALLSASGKHWRKVAMVVATAMNSLPNKIVGLPDVYYSQRVAVLAEQGKLISEGNLRRMRFSEVKVP